MNATATVTNINDHRPIVKADLDKGYDRLAHDITNTLALNPAKLSGCEFQVVFAIIGKTYRYQKKSDWIANSQLCEKTGMSKNHISKTIKSLIYKNIIIKNGRTIGLNNLVSEWGGAQKTIKVNQPVNNEKLTNQCTKVNQSVSVVNQSVNSSTPITPPHKKETITKETITKEKVYAFAGETIRINQRDFEKMTALYTNLNLTSELPQIDFELKGRKDWFAAMNAKLNYRNKNIKPSYQKNTNSRPKHPEPDFNQGAQGESTFSMEAFDNANN